MQSAKFILLAFSLMINSQLCAQDHRKSVEDLLGKMTLEEKIGQLTLYTTDWESTGPTLRAGYSEDIRSGRCGALFNAHTVPFTRSLQKIAVEETRLKIPLLFGYDVVHGYRTIFPIPLAESCSWDLEWMERTARIAAIEAAAAGLHWTFAPMVDISRDPRWGRVMEGAGEDTWLGSRIAEARVRGFQGNGYEQLDAVLACAKHLAGYGAATAGRDYHYTEISPLTMKELYLPPFKAAVEAGVATLMTAFNDISGIPATAHRELLTEILRKAWGFEGFVVTDYTSINELVNHGYAKDEKHAGELAFLAGADMDMQGAIYQQYLAELVREGKVSEALIDQSVSSILHLKYQLGLFDDPYRFSDQDRYDSRILHPSHREAAREMAKRSFVLLKNEDNTLPVSRQTKKIALIGPLGDSKNDMLGAWSAAGEARDCISLLEGLQKRFAGEADIVFAKGTGVEDGDERGFEEALLLAAGSDLVILAIGEHKDLSGEATSRANPILPGAQLELLRQVKTMGKKVAVVLFSGRPLIIPELAEEADAILQVWLPGVEAGHAIAEVLAGDYNPSGKLTMTFPRHVGQIPIYYNERNSGRPFNPNDKWNSKYIDMPNSPLFPFGYGLSYTAFTYSELTTNKTISSIDESVEVKVKVKNTGTMAGEEVVQLYIRDVTGSTTRPVRELRGFSKVYLEPGEEQILRFTLGKAELQCLNQQLEWVVEPGEFHIMAGGNSRDVLLTKIELR
jgi:beta-glucosidase